MLFLWDISRQNSGRKSLLAFLAICIILGSYQAEAAKKYYPKGGYPAELEVTEPTPAPPPPETPAAPPPAPQTITQTIIKVVKAPVKPKDPLQDLIDERRYTEALRLLDQRLRKSPRDINMRFTKAQILRDKENFDLSEAEYKTILTKTKSKPIVAKAYAGLALTQFMHAQRGLRLGDTAESEKYMEQSEASFKQALAANPNDVQALAGYSQWHLSQAHVTQAEPLLQKAMRLAPNNIAVLLVKAEYLLDQDKASDALSYLYKAKQQSAREPRVSLLLGRAFLKEGKNDDAIIQLQQVLERIPDEPNALKLLSEAYQSKAKPDDAQSVLQKAVSLNPSDTEAVKALIKSYDDNKEQDRSLLLLQTLVAERPQQPIYLLELLKRFAREGEWDRVLEYGQPYIEAWTPSETTDETTQALLSTVARAVYFGQKGMIHPKAFKSSANVQKMLTYYQARVKADPSSLPDRLNLLFLDPLASVPVLPALANDNPNTWPLSMEAAFMEGNQPAYQIAKQSLLKADPPISPDVLLPAAQDMLLLGDLAASQMLVDLVRTADANNSNALQLAQNIATARQTGDEKFKALKGLSRRVPKSYWEETAEQVLSVAGGDWRVHAFIAEQLEDRRDYEAAWIQQKLTARYAPSIADREKWLKKAEKTQRKI